MKLSIYKKSRAYETEYARESAKAQARVEEESKRAQIRDWEQQRQMQRLSSDPFLTARLAQANALEALVEKRNRRIMRRATA